MNAEVISIGDELTSGQRLDTNSQWLSQKLGDLGIRVLFHTTVGDDLEANVRVFREAIDRAELIVCTGGLGPTADDLTRQALADATHRALELDEQALAHIRSLFARRQRPMPEQNIVQAYFPAGSRVVPNPHGSAPGIDMDVSRGNGTSARIFALPGVPAEMREMWEQTVDPELRKWLGEKLRVIRHRRIKCFGVGESDLEQMLPDLIRRGRYPSVGITVSRATITLRVTAIGESDLTCTAAIQPTIDTIYQCLGTLAFGEEDDELQDAVIRLLKDRNQTISVAEMGTGGLLSQWLSEADPDHDVFCGAMVVRSGEAHNFEISPNRADVIAGLASRCRNEFNTDWAVSIDRFPATHAMSDAIGEVVVAVESENVSVRKSFPFAGHPDILKARAGKQALNLVRLLILEEAV